MCIDAPRICELTKALAVNINRRSLSKGQRAMILALAYPEANRSGKADPSRFQEGLADTKKTAQNLLSQSRTVLRFLPELAKQVAAGITPLLDAFRVLLANAAAASLRLRRPGNATRSFAF